MQEDFT